MAKIDMWNTWIALNENMGYGTRKAQPTLSLTFKANVADALEIRTFSMDIEQASKLHRRMGAMLKAAKVL